MKQIISQINLREELRVLINDSGHWIVLRQAVPGRLCSCVNPVVGEARKDCNICFASGHAYIDRFIKCRKSRPVQLTQTIDFEANTALGISSVPDAVFYFEFYMKPTQLDYILEVSLSPSDQEPNIPFRVLSIYDITDSREQRDIGGRIEFWAVTAQRKSWLPFDVTEYDEQLPENNNRNT